MTVGYSRRVQVPRSRAARLELATWLCGLLAIGLGVAVLAGTAIWWPEAHWRIRYWMEPSARIPSLGRLVGTRPDAGEFELSHAVRSESSLLSFTAAQILARRGDARGYRRLVELCYEYPQGHLKYDADHALAKHLEADPHLSEHRDADAWWAANRELVDASIRR